MTGNGNNSLFNLIKPMDILRIYMGLALSVKGIYFLSDMEKVLKLGQEIPMFDTFLAWVVVGIHVVCGISLARGFWTRMSAALNFFVLAGAVLFMHGQNGLFASGQQLEFTLLIAFILGLLTWAGSGKFSFDYYAENEL